MGNRKGAGVIDGGVADAANFSGTDAQRTLAASAAMDKRDAQIASMRAAQKDVADMFYSQGGGGSGTGTDNTQVLRALPVEPTPKAIPVGEPEVSWGSRSQYNTSPSNKSPWAGISQGYVEGQGGYGLPAPNTPAPNTPAPRAIRVNTQTPRAIPVNPPAPTDASLNNQLSSMPKEGNPTNIIVDGAGNVVPANVPANAYNWTELEKNMPVGSSDTPPTTMSLEEYPFDEKGNYDEAAVAAAGNKKPIVATTVTNLLNKKKNKNK